MESEAKNMKRVIKFPLIMSNGKEVRTIDELRENFELEKITEYYLEGKLKIWLQHRNYLNELSNFEILESCDNRNEVPPMLCKIFGVEQSINLNISEMERRKNRISILKGFSDDEEWENKLEFIAFTQEELEKKLLSGDLFNTFDEQMKLQRKEVYLCGDIFTVSDKFKNITYAGVNIPTINILSDLIFEAEANDIRFKNVKITSDKKISLKIKQYKSCTIDFDKVNLKNTYDVKYCKTFNPKDPRSTVIDNTGNVHVLGITASGEGHIPKFDAPIIDIDHSISLVVAVDQNGKVYQWGNLPYKCKLVPRDLPKIKQVTVGSNIIIVLDEFGKLHWWGGWGSSSIFSGETSYGELVFKPMPNINSKIVQITCKYNIVMALDENGKVYSWGYCGSPNKSIHKIPENLPFIKKIALFGGDFALALDENGKIHFWGNDYYGSSNIPKDLPCIVDISENNDGSTVYSALDENGRIHIWGERAKWHYDGIKKLPKLRYLVGMGGISEEGYMYNESGMLFNGLKAMLPNT